MGYSSDQMLEKPAKEPKAVLDEHEDQKLSGDMRELYDRILPSEESENRRRLLVKKLETILRDEWPGNEFQVHVFGSSGNLLCTNESDGTDVALHHDKMLIQSSGHLHSDSHAQARDDAHAC